MITKKDSAEIPETTFENLLLNNITKNAVQTCSIAVVVGIVQVMYFFCHVIYCVLFLQHYH